VKISSTGGPPKKIQEAKYVFHFEGLFGLLERGLQSASFNKVFHFFGTIHQ